MESSVEKIEVKGANDHDYSYTAHIENHRILTVVTAAKWLKDAKKANNTSSLPNTLVVGFSVERRYDEFTRHGLVDTPYYLFYLCIGSQRLIYLLDEPATDNRKYRPSKFLNPFFNNPKVVVVGMGIKEKAARLKRDFGVKIKNAVDLNELAVKRMRRDDLDMGRYDLDRPAKAVPGKHMNVVRHVKKLEWFKETYPYCPCVEMNEMKVLFTTTDAYLCYRIGSHLFSMIHGNDSSAAAGSKKKGRRKKKNGFYFLRRYFAAPYKKKKKERKKNKNGKRDEIYDN